MPINFFDIELLIETKKITYPEWYKTEKYYNCEDGWNILKNFLHSKVF